MLNKSWIIIIIIIIISLYIIHKILYPQTEHYTIEKQLNSKTLSYQEFKSINTINSNEKIIPKLIFRTGPFSLYNIPNIVKIHLDNLLKNNPKYTQIYFDDDDCRNFIKEFFPEYLQEYDVLIPTAYKADLWRLLVIYKYGGIYNDIGHIFLEPISNIIEHTEQTILCIDDKNYPHSALYNAFFATYPNNPIIKLLIEQIINNIRNRYYGNTSLSITGPVLWATVINNFLDKSPTSRFTRKTLTYKNHTFTFVEFIKPVSSINFGYIYNLSNIPCIASKFSDYYKLLYQSRNIQHYEQLWNNNQVYKNNHINTLVNKQQQLIGTIHSIVLGPFSISTNEIFYVFNPSIILLDNNIFVVARLSSSSNCKHTLNHSYNQLIENNTNVFDPDYKKNSSLLISFYLNSPSTFNIFNNYITDQNNYINLGMEDPRIFIFQNEPWIYFHYRGFQNNTFKHLPAIFKMSTPQNIIYLYYENMTTSEKNWMPFEFDNKLYFEYSINPHIILECNTSTGKCTFIAIHNFINPLQKHIGGGAPSQLITTKQCYLGIGHTRSDHPHIIRKNFFYTFDPTPPFNITGMSKEFDIESSDNSIEFVSGLIVSNNTVILSAGIQDCYSVIIKYNIDSVFNLIQPIN